MQQKYGQKPIYHTVRYIIRRISYGGSRISFLTILNSAKKQEARGCSGAERRPLRPEAGFEPRGGATERVEIRRQANGAKRSLRRRNDIGVPPLIYAYRRMIYGLWPYFGRNLRFL